MDQRIIKTKNNLYKGLLITMKNKSFEEIKVSDVCKEAHINRSTFYNNFNDKYDLLFSLFHDLEKSNNNNNIASNIFHDTILKNFAENIKNHPLYNEEIPSEIITIFMQMVL